MRAIQLIKGVHSTGAGTPYFLDRAIESQTIYIDFLDPVGGVSAMSVALESCGNLEKGEDLAGGVWHLMRTHVLTAAEISAKQAAFSVVSTPVSVVRLNIVNLIGATASTSINVRYLPEG